MSDVAMMTFDIPEAERRRAAYEEQRREHTRLWHENEARTNPYYFAPIPERDQ